MPGASKNHEAPNLRIDAGLNHRLAEICAETGKTKTATVERTLAAYIADYETKPYYLRKRGIMEGTYVRIAGVTRRAEPYMIKELQLQGTRASFDTLQVVGEVDLHIIVILDDSRSTGKARHDRAIPV